MSDWTQPICLKCYAKRHPGRGASGIIAADKEKCCDCGEPTYEGIFYRVDPDTVQYPTREKNHG